MNHTTVVKNTVQVQGTVTVVTVLLYGCVCDIETLSDRDFTQVLAHCYSKVMVQLYANYIHVCTMFFKDVDSICIHHKVAGFTPTFFCTLSV